MTPAQEQALWDYMNAAAHDDPGARQFAAIQFIEAHRGALSVSGEAPPKEPKRLPTVDEIYGSDPGFTGDEGTVEYLNRREAGGSAPQPEKEPRPMEVCPKCGHFTSFFRACVCAPEPRVYSWTCDKCGVEYRAEKWRQCPTCDVGAAPPKEPPAPLPKSVTDVLGIIGPLAGNCVRGRCAVCRGKAAMCSCGCHAPGAVNALMAAPAPETRSVEESPAHRNDKPIHPKCAMQRGEPCNCEELFLLDPPWDLIRRGRSVLSHLSGAEEALATYRSEKAMAEQETNAWKHWAEGAKSGMAALRAERDEALERIEMGAKLAHDLGSALHRARDWGGFTAAENIVAALRGGKVERD